MVQEMAVDCIRFCSLTTVYLEEALPPTLTAAMEEHLLSCETCRRFIHQMELTIEVLGTTKQRRSSEPISPRLLSAFREWRDTTHGETCADLESRFEALTSRSEADQKTAVVGEEQFRSSDFGGFVMENAVRMGIKDPRFALHLAELAVEIFESLSVPKSGHRENGDSLAQALAVLGNCRKICSDFQGAGEAFVRAERALESGTGNPRARAQMLQMRAQYLADCGQLQKALEDLDRAIDVYRTTCERHNEGRSLIGKGRVLGFSGFVEEAIPCLKKGLELIDRDRDKRLVLVAKHNLVVYLSDMGSSDEAVGLLAKTRELHRELSNKVDLIRFKWLEGKVARDLSRMEAAERLFLETKTYFVENEMPFDVALVSLDLAMVYLKQGRFIELKELAEEMVTIFRGLGVRRELLAAMAFFEKAREIEQSAAIGLLQELVEVLEKSRQRASHHPSWF